MGRRLRTDKLPLGVLYLYQSLKIKFGNAINVEILDICTKDETFNFNEYLQYHKPDLVGLSIHSTSAFPFGVEIANTIRKIIPEIIIIAGGLHPSIEPERTIIDMHADIVVRGEGELILNELVEVINSGKDLSTVKGISYKNEHGKIIYTPPGKLPSMNALPFIPPKNFNIADYELETPYMIGPTINIMFSRGCPYLCNYCSYKAISGRVSRTKSVERQVEEIEYIINTFGINNFYFFDDNIGFKRERMEMFCHLILNKRLKINWRGQIRADLLNREFLSLMKQSGLNHLSFGIESGDQYVLDKMNKGITIEQIKNAASWCNELGIHTRFFLMVGLPYQTFNFFRYVKALIKRRQFSLIIKSFYLWIRGQWISSIDKSIKLLEETIPDELTVEFFMPFPGSTISKNLSNWGIKIIDRDLSHYKYRIDWMGLKEDISVPVIKTDWMSNKDIYKAKLKLFTAFNNLKKD